MSHHDRASTDLLVILREVIEQADPVPTAAIDAAKASLTWRTVDAELAELTSDTGLTGAAVRSQHPPRMLTFTAGETTLLVEVTDELASRRLLGQVVGAGPVELSIRHADGSTTVGADEYGRFAAASIPPGLMSLTCTLDSGESLVTSWVRV